MIFLDPRVYKIVTEQTLDSPQRVEFDIVELKFSFDDYFCSKWPEIDGFENPPLKIDGFG